MNIYITELLRNIYLYKTNVKIIKIDQGIVQIPGITTEA